jgi:hypothetical protein
VAPPFVPPSPNWQRPEELSQERDRWFESGSLQQRVQCEPAFFQIGGAVHTDTTQAPARRLPNLTNIPAIVITTEGSYHAAYYHCTAKYLAQAGVRVTALRLGDQGIHGNGHMVMLEKNNPQVAGLIVGWLARTIEAH